MTAKGCVVKVKISAGDVRVGKPSDPKRCAFALALRGAIGCPNADEVEIKVAAEGATHVVTVRGEGRSEQYILPTEARRWMGLFDSGLPVPAAEFDLGDPLPISGFGGLS